MLKKFAAMFIFLIMTIPTWGQGVINVKRFAIVIGANDGGSGRVKLKYAVSDANSYMKVLKEMGGVEGENGILIYNPDRRNVYSAFNKMKQILQSNKGGKVELFFYYSGHSDEEGILLSGEKISYPELKKMIMDEPADVRVAILDSCSSGAFTRMKGGKMGTSFLVDSSYDMKGNAFITSSSADEASQESDKIKGSFFTHFLVSGMRGAADITQDKKITLNEVYQYAYSETLSRTEKTMGGAQHPNYNIEMIGTGDVILTDVSRSSSTLIIKEELSGVFFIRNSSNDILAAEVKKPYGRDMEVGLEPGDYNVTNDSEDGLYKGSFSVSRGGNFALSKNKMEKVNPEKTTKRGDDEPDDKKDDKNRIPPVQYVYDLTGLNISAYGGITQSVGRINNRAAYLVGGRGGIILDNNFVIGGAGCGMVFPRDRSVLSGKKYTGNEKTVYLGYGGFLIEYYVPLGRRFHISAGICTGAGGYSLNSSQDTSTSTQSTSNKSATAFFVAKPEIDLWISVVKYCRVGFGVSYVYTNGMKSSVIDSKLFNGFYGEFIVAFGYF